MTKWVTAWAGGLTTALLTYAFGYTAEFVEDRVEGDDVLLPWAPETADIVATAVLMGIVSVPILALRRRAIVQQAELAAATTELTAYRARDRESAQAVAGRRTTIRACILRSEERRVGKEGRARRRR